MQMTKKITSIVLAVLMVVSMMSVMAVSANAADPVDYYVVGTMNNWETSDAYKLDKNPENNGEYMFKDLKVSANTELKVKDSNGAFYPDGMGNNFTLNAAGTYDLYFRPDGSGNPADGWHYGTIFANNYREPVYAAQIGSTKYETLEAAFAAAQDGDKITLLADCAGNGIKAPQGKFATNGLTVDFNNHTYTVDGETVGSLHTETNGFQLLKDNKITFKNGTITSAKAKILVQNYSNLTLDGMTLTLDNPNYTGAYTLSNNNGNTVIKGSTIKANPAGGFAFDVCRFSSYPSVNVTVTDNSTINGNVEISASNGDAKNGFSLTLESGTLNGDIVVDASAKSLIGEDNTVTKKDTFTQDAPAGYKWVSNEDGTSSLVAKKYVAQIGDNKYETLEAAFAAAEDGNTITVLADCAGNGIIAPQGKFATNGLTVDFNNHTYTVDGETVGSLHTETNGFQLLKDNKITFKNGAITSEKAKILVQNYSDLTLDGMTLTLDNPNYNGAYTLSNNNGEVVINDTKINANTGGGFAFDVCRFSSYPSVSVTVTGDDSVINGNVEISASNGDAKNGFSLTLESGTLNGNIVVDASAKSLIGEDNKVTKKDTFTQDAPADYKWVSNGDGTSSLVAKKYVAQDVATGTKYESLEDAIAAISTKVTSEYHSRSGLTIKKYTADGEIKLLADCEGNGIAISSGSDLTIDFDGHTYNVNGDLVGSNGTESIGFQLLQNSVVTFKNGTITSNQAQMIIQNYSDLTLDKMTIDGTNMAGDGNYVLSNNKGNVVIKDTTIDAREGCIAFDVCRFRSYPSVNVTVKGTSEINGNVEVDAGNGDAKDGFSLTLESGTMTGDIKLTDGAAKAIAATPIKAGVVKNNTFTQEAPLGHEWVDNGDGTSKLVPATYPLDALITKASDGNQFGINSKYLAGTLLGVQKKDAIADADVTSESHQESGNDIRFVAVLDTKILQDAEDYGFVLAKANRKTKYSDVNFDNLKAHWGNGEKTISALNTYNTVCGTTEDAQKYGDPTDDTTDYKYITCAVNGMSDDDMVVARFYVVIGGKTYYAKYAGHDYKYTGCMTKADLVPVAD